MSVEPNNIAVAAKAAPDIWAIVLPAFFGLFGVIIGGVIQAASSLLTAGQQRRFRLLDEATLESREMAKVEADRSFARAILARHLEGYARSCAQAMIANDDEEERGATLLPPFPEWPDVPWELLGPSEMMKARDIEVRVDMQTEWAKNAVWYGAADEREARTYYKDAAAHVGLEAWRVAQRMRIEAKVEPFEFPFGLGGFAATLEDHVEKLNEQERARLDHLAKRANAKRPAG